MTKKKKKTKKKNYGDVRWHKKLQGLRNANNKVHFYILALCNTPLFRLVLENAILYLHIPSMISSNSYEKL